jgi:hypothetical protein
MDDFAVRLDGRSGVHSRFKENKFVLDYRVPFGLLMVLPVSKRLTS